MRRHHETGPDRRLGHRRRSRTGPCRLLRDQFREQSGQFTCREQLRGHELAGPVAGGSQPAAQGQTAGSGSLTPPGTHLAFGGPATVGWVPPSQDTGTGAHHGIKLQVTVVSIQKGTMADFRNVELNANERKSTPYYVQLRVTALSSTPVPKDSDPAITFTAIDDRGQEQQSITFLGTFSRCDDPMPPKQFVSGKTYQSCLAYLIPGGGSIQKVQWDNGPAAANQVTPYFDRPIVWG